MLYFILLAFFNGIIIGLNRAINGKLSDYIGPFQASFVNHFVGFLFLTILFFSLYQFEIPNQNEIPLVAYFGGFFGVFMVALSSYSFMKLGATKSLIYAISAQMLTCVIIDTNDYHSLKFIGKLIGVCFIILGVYLLQKGKEGAVIEKNLNTTN
ncbi:DMT family transporter [Pigmentibacter ruber]